MSMSVATRLESDSLGAKPACLDLRRGIALSGLKWLRSGVPVQIIGDSAVLIDCLLGRSATRLQHLLVPLREAQSRLTETTRRFGIRPPHESEIAQQTRRAENQAADAAANQALDIGSFKEFYRTEVARLALNLSEAQGNSNVGVLISFDGASRGNPGPASSGVCAWWGRWSDGAFQSSGLVGRWGRLLGHLTNNEAEAQGLSDAARRLARILLTMTEVFLPSLEAPRQVD